MAVGVALFACYLLTLGRRHYSTAGIVTIQSAKPLLFRHRLVIDPLRPLGA